VNQRTSCPYCNAGVVVPDPIPASARLECPRCHEQFPYRGTPSTNTEVTTPPIVVPTLPVVQTPSRRYVWLTLVVLLVGAIIGYQFIGAPPTRPIDAVVQLPWRTIGWLPAEANVIFSVRPGDSSAAFAEQMLRLPANVRNGIESLIGRPLQSLEEFTFGLRVDNGGLPGVFLVLRGREPFAVEPLQKFAKSTTRKNDRTIYSVQTPGLPVELSFWMPASHTLIAALNDDDIAAVPDTASASFDAQRTSFRSTFFGLPKDQCAVLVADLKDWDRLLIARTIAGRISPEIGPTQLAKCREIIATITPNDRQVMVFDLAISLQDQETADRLREYLSRKVPNVEIAPNAVSIRLELKPETFATFLESLRPDKER